MLLSLVLLLSIGHRVDSCGDDAHGPSDVGGHNHDWNWIHASVLFVVGGRPSACRIGRHPLALGSLVMNRVALGVLARSFIEQNCLHLVEKLVEVIDCFEESFSTGGTGGQLQLCS